MDTLESMRVFVRVVDLGGLSGAARSLNLSPSMVAKHVAHVESRTGALLLNRTTRSVRPTEIGQAYYENCVSALAAIEAAENAAGAEQQTPRGMIRITAPVEFGNAHLAPLVAAFLRQHPEISVTLDFSNRIVDIVQEGFDLAIRIAKSLDTSLVGRRVATSRFHVVASPEYVAGCGEPLAPADLSLRPCLSFAVPTPWEDWRFVQDGAVRTVRLQNRLLSSSSEALRQAALDGAGISLLPSFVCGRDIREGRLVTLLRDCDPGALSIYALYPDRRFLPARVRAFIDFLVDSLGPDPDQDPWA